MAAQVHLEEPVLGVDESLRPEQVVGVVGVDLRDAVVVADDLDLARQTRHADLALGRRERTAHPGHRQNRDNSEDDDEQGRHGHGDAAGENDARHPARLSAPHRGKGRDGPWAQASPNRPSRSSASRGAGSSDSFTLHDLDAGAARGLARAARLGRRGAALGRSRGCPRCSSTSASGWPSASPALGIRFDSNELTQVLGYAALDPHPLRGRPEHEVGGHPPLGRAGRGAVDRRRHRVGAVVALRRAVRPATSTGTPPCSSAPSCPRPTPRRSSPCCAGCRCPGASPACSRPSPGFNDAPVVILVDRPRGRSADPADAEGWFTLALKAVVELGVGAAIGLAVGWLGGQFMRRAAAGSSGLFSIGVVALTVLAYAAAASVHASGFIACYLAALVLGNMRLPHGRPCRGFVDALWAGWPRSGCSSCSACSPSPSKMADQVAARDRHRPGAAARRPAPVGPGVGGAVPDRLARPGLPLLGRAARRRTRRARDRAAHRRAPERRLDLRARLRARRHLHHRPGADPAVGGPAARASSRTTARLDLAVEATPLEELGAELIQVTVGPASRLHGVEIFELRLPAGRQRHPRGARRRGLRARGQHRGPPRRPAAHRHDRRGHGPRPRSGSARSARTAASPAGPARYAGGPADRDSPRPPLRRTAAAGVTPGTARRRCAGRRRRAPRREEVGRRPAL